MAAKGRTLAVVAAGVAAAAGLYLALRRSRKTTAGYGAWQSPISSEMIVKGSIRISDVQAVDGYAYWVELRPMEAGRYVVVRCRLPASGGKEVGPCEDAVPKGFNARTRVHEYGGGSFLAVDAARVLATGFADQRLHWAGVGKEEGVPLTKEGPMRFADMAMDARRNRIIAVREDHTVDEPAKVVNTIVAVDLSSGAETVLASGADFYLAPCLDESGDHLAFVAYDHPNMPWDSTRLVVADLNAEGAVTATRIVAGNTDPESITQPKWHKGELFCISDRSGGFWNIHKYDAQSKELVCVCPVDGECAGPHWQFGNRTYGFVDDDTILCAYSPDTDTSLSLLSISTGKLTPVPSELTSVSTIAIHGRTAVVLGGNHACSPSVFALDLDSLSFSLLKAATSTPVSDDFLSPPTKIEYPTENGKTAFAQFYAPQNAQFEAPDGELPPLLVKLHGGPTSNASSTLRLDIQYWTSKGFAVADVDYGGSTGYGREFRNRLNGLWGVVDVADCANCARYLADEGIVDGKRLAIDGGSAGGFTTLAALAFTDVFSAGCSLYGVADLRSLVSDTHKFEKRYLENLVPASEYDARSPINSVDSITCPVLILQGTEDKVVPPNQAKMMYKAVKAKGIPTAMILFEGEQHGFRAEKNIRRALDAECLFYARVFGFTASVDSAPLEIDNL